MRQATRTTKPRPQLGCKLCRTLNDGICGAFCTMDKAQQRQLIQKYKHLFKAA